jgi:FkbM family methyltransferase
MSDKALNLFMDTSELCMESVKTMHNEFFSRMDYDWYYKVEPGDVCVDVGACVGMFTAHALDRGASKVYAIEPNPKFLKAVINNTWQYIVDEPTQKVVPVSYAIGSDMGHTDHVFYTDEFEVRPFSYFLEKFEIGHIDYLKIDCEGGEYDVLSKENLDFCINNVKHIAVECHLRASDDGHDKFIKFRNEFLKPFIDSGKFRMRFMNNNISEILWDDKRIRNTGGEFMIYLTKING